MKIFSARAPTGMMMPTLATRMPQMVPPTAFSCSASGPKPKRKTKAKGTPISRRIARVGEASKGFNQGVLPRRRLATVVAPAPIRIKRVQ
jgi:hypothetical protein